MQETLHCIGNGNDYGGITLKSSDQNFIHFNTTMNEHVFKCIIQYLEERFQNIKGGDQTMLAIWPLA